MLKLYEKNHSFDIINLKNSKQYENHIYFFPHINITINW